MYRRGGHDLPQRFPLRKKRFTAALPMGCGAPHRRWLQDTSKRKLVDFFLFFSHPPPPLPVPPGSPEVDPTIDKKTSAPG